MNLSKNQVPLVDPCSGSTMWVDEGQIIPAGYVLADDLTTKDWFAILDNVRSYKVGRDQNDR